MAVAQTPSPALRAKLAALAAVHADWVEQHLDSAPFDPGKRKRKRKSDYNLHYVDLEADDDEFHHLAAAALDSATATRAAGHDTTPGHDELHHYWTRGEGLAKWAGSPTPWTTLVALLTPHVGPEKAKVYASRWFYEVKGYYSGSDKNRVATGHPPRGHRVGPG